MAERTLKVGDAAPLFSLKTSGEDTVSLSDFRGRRVVLYFYPKDDTPGCTKEACGFRDAAARLRQAHAVVLGISRDSVASHERFRNKYGLSFPLLSDPDVVVCTAYGVYKQKSMYGRLFLGIERTTFIIDEEGRIASIFPKVSVEGHLEAVLQALQSGASEAPKNPAHAAPAPKGSTRVTR